MLYFALITPSGQKFAYEIGSTALVTQADLFLLKRPKGLTLVYYPKASRLQSSKASRSVAASIGR